MVAQITRKSQAPIKILSITHELTFLGNFGVERETEKAYLLASSATGNRPCWFPKSAFEPLKDFEGKPMPSTRPGVFSVEIKNWFSAKASSEQLAILHQVATW